MTIGVWRRGLVAMRAIRDESSRHLFQLPGGVLLRYSIHVFSASTKGIESSLEADGFDYQALLLLNECDRIGRVPRARVPELDDVFDALRELARTCG